MRRIREGRGVGAAAPQVAVTTFLHPPRLGLCGSREPFLLPPSGHQPHAPTLASGRHLAASSPQRSPTQPSPPAGTPAPVLSGAFLSAPPAPLVRLRHSIFPLAFGTVHELSVSRVHMFLLVFPHFCCLVPCSAENSAWKHSTHLSHG